MTIVVFAGPSIVDIEPAAFAGIDLRAPAACGDVLAAARSGASVIGLIDGVFGSVASVWHKEILWALAAGVRVIGAASMGALRAAECARFGMEGVGQIYEDYRSGRRWSDADVAVLHAPAEMGWRSLSEPLVDVEATIELLRSLSLLSDEEESRLRWAARHIHYRDRVWSELFGRALPSDERRSEVESLVQSHAVRLKERDARLLLRTVATDARSVGRMSRLVGEPLSVTAYLGVLARRVQASESGHCA